MLNKIYGKNIFPQKIYESTSTVCKIRNSEKIRIKIENEQGNIEDVTKDEFDLSTKSGVEKFKTKIAELTNIRSSSTSIRFRSVEIELPFPFLKVGSFSSKFSRWFYRPDSSISTSDFVLGQFTLISSIKPCTDLIKG